MPRIEFDESDGAKYCETSDVARWFEQYDDFTGSTSPTATEVEDHIFEWMEYIDRETGHAWRDNTVVQEMKDPDGSYYWWSGRAYNLSKRDVREPDSAQGDKLEEFGGSGHNDWVTDSSKTYGRGEEYWLDKTAGILYIDRLYWFRRHPHFRITYRYGNPNGPTRAIKMACAKLVAQDLASSDQYSMNIPGTDGAMDQQTMAERWKEQADDVIDERREVEYVEPF